jgi:hypothetical protein
VRDWHYALKIGNQPVPMDVVDAVVSVPSRSCQELELRQKLDLTALFGDDPPMMAAFEVSAAPSVDGVPLGAISRSGTFALPRPPSLSFGRLHVTKRSDSFAVELDVLVQNPNDFPVTIQRYEGELLIAGNRFGRMQGGEVTIAPRGREALPVKATASVMSLNGLARAALSSTEAISTDVNAKLVIAGKPYARSAGGMVYPR